MPDSLLVRYRNIHVWGIFGLAWDCDAVWKLLYVGVSFNGNVLYQVVAYLRRTYVRIKQFQTENKTKTICAYS